jgi:hypothetical protein
MTSLALMMKVVLTQVIINLITLQSLKKAIYKNNNKDTQKYSIYPLLLITTKKFYGGGFREGHEERVMGHVR